MKSVSEMEAMTYENLLEYLKSENPSKEELCNLLKNINIPYRKYESRNKILEHTAREISMIGIFKRIAGNNKRKDDIQWIAC